MGGRFDGRNDERARPIPVFASSRSSVPPSRRLLLVSYHFPPDPSVGGLRWQKLARYARERGWGVDVLSLHPEALVTADLGRLADLPPDTRVFGVLPSTPRTTRAIERVWSALRPAKGTQPTGGAAGARSASRAMADLRWWPPGRGDLARAYHVWADAASGRAWARDAVRLGRAVVERGLHRAVVSSGPPHFCHSAARELARMAGIPFVMDMRDPWSLVQRLPDHLTSPLWMAMATAGERRSVRDAALVVTNTDPHRDALCRRHPAEAERIISITNGSDEDEPLPPRRWERRFVVAYAGTIYLDRDPRPLFQAAARTIRTLGLAPEEFGIELMGDVAALDGVPLRAMAEASGIAPFVQLHPAGPRAAAQSFLAGAALLLLLHQDSTYAIPAKLFEYLRHEAWVLALADRESAVERLLRGSSADVVAPEDVDGIAAVLERRMLAHRSGERPAAIVHEGAYGRRAQAERLLAEIERITGVTSQTGQAVEVAACT